MPMYETAVFGNRGGSHQLLSSSLPPADPVLDALRFIVDRPAGHVGKGVTWSPYWGCQPIEQYWVLWRGEEDLRAPRKNMVTATVAILPIEHCASVGDLGVLLNAVGHTGPVAGNGDVRIVSSVLDCLAKGEGPAIVTDLSVAPFLLAQLWPRLWPSARASLSLRTLFGAESLDSVLPASIVVIPSELKPRWLGQRLISPFDAPPGPAARFFSGNASPSLARLISANTALLPADFTVIDRIDRIVERLDRLNDGQGTVTDALLIARTQEAFPHGLALPTSDMRVVNNVLGALDTAPVQEIRGASLVRLEGFPDLGGVEAAVSRWIEKNLPLQEVADSLWILEQHLGESHADWWRRSVGRGLDAGCRAKTQQWATAIWQWWQARTESVRLIICHIENTLATEEWLAASAPPMVNDALLDELEAVCREREWPTLFARVLGSTRTLAACVERLRGGLRQPERGLPVLVSGRSAAEIVDAGAVTCWPPLVIEAVRHTIADPTLLARVLGARGLIQMLSRHLSEGGEFPCELVRADLFKQLFDAALKQDRDALTIVTRLDWRAGHFVLDFPNSEALLPHVPSEVVRGAVEDWWQRFLGERNIGRPPPSLCREALNLARSRSGGKPIALVIALLRLFTEIREAEFEEWMNHTGFRWEAGDHQRLATILVERKWATAAKTFRWSWKKELVLVAWHAKELLSWWDQFWTVPDGANQLIQVETNAIMENKINVLFLAANPTTSLRLALDEEARAIEEKVRDSKYRDRIIIRTLWAVRPDDLQQALLENEPTVVHFSGHGGGVPGIVLHGSDQTQFNFVTADALSDLFRVLKDDIRVIVLNACYSEVQAMAIVKEIDFVVGMSDTIGDEAARVFAAAFYRGLAFGRSVRVAFDLGINEIKLAGLTRDDTIPQLLVRAGADVNAILVSATSA